MPNSFSFKLEITLLGPFLTKGQHTGQYGLDQMVHRNHVNELVIPGSHIMGHVRQQLKNLQGEKFCNELFGVQSRFDASSHYGVDFTKTSEGGDDETDPYEPQRRKIFFSDFKADKQPEKVKTNTRIKVNAKTGSVETGSLLIAESPFAIGEKVKFTGVVEVFGERKKGEQDEIEKLVLNALELTPALGSNKGIGFGWVKSVELNENDASEVEDKFILENIGDDFVLAFSLDRPFLVDSQKPSANHLYGSEIIPGGVIKAVIAHNLEGDFEAELSELTITHARPYSNNKFNPYHAHPLSLYTSGETVGDAIIGKVFKGDVTFSDDWKEPHKAVGKKYGNAPTLKRTIRTRTAINNDTGASDDGRLFSYVSVVPDEHLWVARLSLSDDATKEFKDALCAALNQPLGPIGKTDAWATVCKDITKIFPAPASAPTSNTPNQWHVTLQTPAVLLSYENFQSAREKASPKDALAAYWQAAYEAFSGESGGLKMVKAYTKQKWAGGYIATRYKYDAKNGAYHPFLLFQPGSVFLIEAEDGEEDKIGKFMEHIARHGLPPDGHFEFDKELWEKFPYCRENGFGEVYIDENPMTIPEESGDKS